MQLRTVAGAYAGQIRTYSTPAGLAAIRSGTAEPIEANRDTSSVRDRTSATSASTATRSSRSARHARARE